MVKPVGEAKGNFPVLSVPNFVDNKTDEESTQVELNSKDEHVNLFDSNGGERKSEISQEVILTPALENGSAEEKDAKVEAIIEEDKHDVEVYLAKLVEQVVDEAAKMAAALESESRPESDDKEKQSKKFVVHSFSTPYRPSTQPTFFRPVSLNFNHFANF